MIISKKTFFLTLLIGITVSASYLIEEKLHHFAGSLLGHSIGILGSVFILIIFLYPVRKYFMPWGGPMKEWLNWHMFFGITGPLLIIIHGAFHFHALVALFASLLMVVNVMSGLVGRYLYIDARKALQQKEENLRQQGVPENELEERLLLEATSVELMGNWRLIHYPISALFLGLMIFHIISVLYFKGV